MNLQRLFLWTMIGSLSLAALLGIWAVLMPRFGALQEKVLLTSVLVGVYALPALGCAFVMHRNRLRPIMWIGIVSAGLSLAIWLLMIWEAVNYWSATWELLLKSGLSFTVATIWAAHLGLLMLLRLAHPGSRIVRLLTLFVVAMLAALVLGVIWTEYDHDHLLRILGVEAILASCGTLITPILRVIEVLKARAGAESIPSRVLVDLTCPRCKMRQRLAAGHTQCDSCGLRIGLDIEEPRCTCGYLLYRLTGEKCPECGRVIPEQDRWAAVSDDESAPAAPSQSSDN